jgi:signal transduction histidine kinase
MVRVPETRIEYPEQISTLPEDSFSNKVLDIIHPNNDVLKLTEISSGYKVIGPCILFIIKDRQVLTYIHSTETPIAVERRIFAFKVTSADVTPEYLAALLVRDDVFRRQMTQSSVYRNPAAIRYLLNRSIVIENLSGQEAFLRRHETKESSELRTLRAAEDARYHINKAGSDIAHMLGSVFKKQNELIGEIPFIEPGSEKYQSYVTSLIDTAQYINRVITAVGKDLAKAKITPKKVNISDAIADYVRAWGNFSGLEDFMLITQDLTQGDVVLKIDIVFLRIMLDTLIDNAWRHGFDKGSYKVDEGNKIAIRLTPVILDEKRYIAISVMNNGHPLSDGYSVTDYIERGNFKGNAGRTGLGGHHVYTIAQRHGGHISLNGEQNWSFVVDILLPIESAGSTVFNTEYDGEYV